MENDDRDGLLVQFDEESGTFTLEWDEEAHPEYNLLKLVTPEQFSRILSEQLEELIEDEDGSDVQSGGSGSGAPEIYDHPQPQE